MKKIPIKRQLAVFRTAKNLVKRGWCQHAAARNIQNLSRDVHSEDACQWCTTGAIDLACMKHFLSFQSNVKMWDVFKKINTIIDIVDWNDSKHRTREDIINAFYNVIHVLEKTK